MGGSCTEAWSELDQDRRKETTCQGVLRSREVWVLFQVKIHVMTHSDSEGGGRKGFVDVRGKEGGALEK